MSTEEAMADIGSERLRHLEALASLISDFLEEARYIDAYYNQASSDMARELRALGYHARN